MGDHSDDLWAENEKPAREALKTFERLYELHGAIRREEERVELVLGDGILNWRRPEGGIHHPILLQRVQLHFRSREAGVHRHRDRPETWNSTRPFFGRCQTWTERRSGSAETSSIGVRTIRWRAKGTSGFLRRLVQTLSSRGEFLGDGEPKGESDDPRIGRDTVLVHAHEDPRLLDSPRRYPERSRISDRLAVIAPQDRWHRADSRSGGEWRWPDGPSTVTRMSRCLLSKPANPEQLQLARRLDSHGCVLVQGHPERGKTHTIGNLLGHLLATGNRVLVTSHTTKALRMVREHVVPQLQPLCVSVLENDAGSRDQLKHSIEGIVEKWSTDVDRLEQEANGSTRQRGKTSSSAFVQQAEDPRRPLTNEYRDIVVGAGVFATV